MKLVITTKEIRQGYEAISLEQAIERHTTQHFRFPFVALVPSVYAWQDEK